MNIVIITAKGGNTSIANKNMLQVAGRPVLFYSIQAAMLSSRTDEIYLTTEDAEMKKYALSLGIKVIERPAYLSQPDSLHKDVIKHAVEEIKNIHPQLKNCIVLLGNTVMISKELIDAGFEELEKEDCDSVLSAWKAQDDHPYRALKLNEEGYLESFLNMQVGSNRQSYSTAYFYDQGIFGFHWECAFKQEGMPPWVWMGKRCKLIERIWITGRDIHTWIDVAASHWYLSTLQSGGLDYYSIINKNDK